MKQKNKGRFIGIQLRTLGASLLGNLLTSNGVKRSKIPGRGVMLAGEDIIRAVEGTVRTG